ncbi:AsmA family protein [Noviherbaspirillum pedocola]|uniref:AsmA family protein n=1 Tax=Noviherbaspirillum pedocola TaxID=2801341 RepID=A0A934SMB6_9BURK|nr:AsmA family protein [Noviherbaspirillum pedocola]MBK4733110.1 AsmA family protein [Noviherbaspirillum pedocola]
MSAHALPRSTARTWRRRIAIIAACLAVAALALIIAAHALFDGERLIALAREHARREWSRDLDISKLSLSLLPAPTLRAQGVTLSNPDWARQPRMAEIDSLDVRLAILPLLSGRVAPTAVHVRGLRLDLERDANGRANWQLAPGHGRIDWRHLNTLSAEAAELRWSNAKLSAEHSALDLSLPLAELRADTGWKAPHLTATLARHGVDMLLDARCDDLSALRAADAAADAATDCKLAATLEGARLALSGKLPLSADGSIDAAIEADAPHPEQLLAFFDMPRHRTAMSLRARIHGAAAASGIHLSDLHARFGSMEADARMTIHPDAKPPSYEADIAIPRLDWAQLSREAGREPPAAAPGTTLFRRAALPWQALSTLADADGRIRLHVGEAKLLSGIAATKLDADIALGGGAIDVSRYTMHLLGGSAAGALRLDPTRRRARLDLAARDVLLERWFSERGRKLPLSGGPMTIDAQVTGHGDSMTALAATLDGAIDVRGGRTVIRSERAGEVEKLLTDMLPLFSEQAAQRMTLECFAGRLRFANGRAAGGGIVGARSDVSQLLTSGAVDLRQQDVDLRGRVRARHGVAIGISVLTSDVRIHGPLKKPAIALDPAATPGALARLGAALLTGGLSLIATAAWDAANPATDACAAVFRPGKDK